MLRTVCYNLGLAIGILWHTHTRPWVYAGTPTRVRRYARGCVRVYAQVCAGVRALRAGVRGGCARAFNLVGYRWHTKKTKFEKKEIPMPIL